MILIYITCESAEQEKFDEIEKEVLKLHSSDTPCLIAIPATNVAKKYFDWIKGEIS